MRCRAAETGLRPCRRPVDRGFTLVEVLVALVIVAVTLGAGIQAAGALTRNAQRLAEMSEAQWCADNHLAGLRLSRQFPSVGDFEFQCEQLGRRYVGRLVVRPTPNPALSPRRRTARRRAGTAAAPAVHRARSPVMHRAPAAAFVQPKPPVRRPAGFTLVEVLVALMIMAVIATMAWQGVDAIVRSRDIAERAAAAVAAAEHLLAQWEQDLAALQDTPAVPALSFDGASLRLTRRHRRGHAGGRLVAAIGHAAGGAARPAGTAGDGLAALGRAGGHAAQRVAGALAAQPAAAGQRAGPGPPARRSGPVAGLLLPRQRLDQCAVERRSPSGHHLRADLGRAADRRTHRRRTRTGAAAPGPTDTRRRAGAAARDERADRGRAELRRPQAPGPAFGAARVPRCCSRC